MAQEIQDSIEEYNEHTLAYLKTRVSKRSYLRLWVNFGRNNNGDPVGGFVSVYKGEFNEIASLYSKNTPVLMREDVANDCLYVRI